MHATSGNAGVCETGSFAACRYLSSALPGSRLTDEMPVANGLPAKAIAFPKILIDASDGASDYGNKFGDPEIAMLVAKIGGPAYRIGMGGGAASSIVSGQNDAEFDFNAVQRGDAEMAQKLYRVIRACAEMGKKNPIISIHDQGAGGNCNVVKEIIYPKGAEIDIRSIVAGDHTLCVLEIWGVEYQEYQEQDALLVKPETSGNWMYAAKLDGEGADMYDAGVALADCMIELGIAIDGGKDSLSMAAQCDGEVVKAPGNLVISAYVTYPDITLTITPDLKLCDDGVLLHIDLGKGKRRLGCSALTQAFDQIGNDCPDIEDVLCLKKVFDAVQELLSERLISADHDISDGGLIVTVLEMAFAEELGLVLEVHSNDLNAVRQKLHVAGVSANVIGKVTTGKEINLVVDGEVRLKEKTSDLRDMWEETSFQLEKLQRLKSCVKLEKEGLKSRTSPSWSLSFTPKFTEKKLLATTTKPKVAIIREEGSSSDREMSAAFHAADFEPWDITMSDLLTQKISITEFRGLAFVGSFSYADVLDSAKGWAASIRFNQPLIEQFQEFYNRPDTFSLGVCNGCQLMALLGCVPGPDVGGSLGVGGDISQPRFIHNESVRFECRFTSVAIGDSPSIMFKGMEGSTLGIWSAHGEGRAFFPDENILSGVVKSNLAPLRYCDDSNNVTEVYPFNAMVLHLVP
ncbi:putative phosphoribosylformylglycinamidine synthase, chloroplastic/mitochondrial [Dichanthelium oligosanthes]|uniref:Putative phosphoribosylformylglycinamidine synthase, chloroplastic/mitochondrial n=1 Tax=Dichanthelium oligosanthes TaxID=888268 RepID=A0A1E5W079_9POAL|nr:putative phosphoribosylformylglycinamidine synthase, chloroplastic/mitochondrial [Dichanthelium oligosanthes]